MPEKNKEDLGICVRCKKNKATLTFTDSILSWSHGFTEEICQECYNKQMRESNWYKQGYQQGKQEVIEDEIKFLDIINCKDNCKNVQELIKVRLEELTQKLNQEKEK